METVKELILDSIRLLRSSSILSSNYAKPYYPTCIFYFGKRSVRHHYKISEDMLRGWGGNAEYVKLYLIEDPCSKKILDLSDYEYSSVNELKTQITDLLSSQDVFADMTRIALYCMIDTADISDPKEFEQWYPMISFLAEAISVPTLSMLMVLLDESLQNTELAQGIKHKIRDAFQDEGLGGKNAHLYDSVFVLGNRMKNGSFLKREPGEREYETYHLPSDIILLSNTRSEDYNNRRSRLYGSNKPALAAAYGFVQKPMTEIVMITLKVIVDKLKELSASHSIDVGALTKALGIDKGRSEICEGFYAEVKSRLPDHDFMNWLPGPVSLDRSFDECNAASDGCLEAFLENYHVTIVSKELSDRGGFLRKEIFELLSKELSASQLKDGIPASLRETAYAKGELAYGNPGRQQVEAAIEMKVKGQIAKGIRLNTEEALDLAVAKAEACMCQFKQLCSELDRIFAVGEEGTRKNLTNFYGERAKRHYSDFNQVEALLHKVLKIENGKADMLQILLDELKAFFGIDPVYQLSFSEELMERLGSIETEKRAQEYIGQELIKNLDDKASFYSTSTFQTRSFEAYLLNTHGRHNNLLFKYLDERDIPPEVSRTFFNTYDNDMAESIWFYVCSIDNLTL